MISSTEETHASQPHAQSDLMNYQSEEFLQIDKWKWDDILAYGNVARKSPEENLEIGFKFGTTP